MAEQRASALRTYGPPAFVLVVFVVSRAWLYHLGVRLTLEPLYWYWQLIDRPLLEHDLWRSLFYLHSQPPLYNLYLGLGLAAFGTHARAAFALISALGGLGLSLTLYAVARRLGSHPWLAAGLAALFSVAPSTLLFEHWLFYTYPVAVLLAYAALALARYLDTRAFRWAFTFFALLAAVALMRSLYHLAWLVLITGGLTLALRGQRRQVLAAAAVPLLLVTALYTKNLLVFGSFSGSSWAGISLAKISLGEATPELKQQAHDRGELSDTSMVPLWSDVTKYPAADRPPPTGIPVLDQPLKVSEHPNYNHLAYVGIGRKLGHDAARFILAHPAIYLKGVAKAFSAYFRPASAYSLVYENGMFMIPYIKGYNTLVLGVWPGGIPKTPPAWLQRRLSGEHAQELVTHVFAISYTQLLAFPLLWLFAVRFLLDRRQASDRRILVGFLFFNVAWLTLVTNLIEIGENNRIRYEVDPLYVLLLGLALQQLYRRWSTGSLSSASTPNTHS